MAIGCYTPAYLPGSFRAVGFVAIEVESEHGRRGAEGEFPFGEQTAYADLGRRIRTYNIRAKFEENNHILQSAALIAACELPGPGVLVHPTRGVLNVACRNLRINDKVEDEQGVTYVDMEFVEANLWPNGLSLVGQLLGLAFGALLGASRANFTSRYNTAIVQPFRRDAVITAAQEQINNIIEFYSSATSDDTTASARNRNIYDLTRLATTPSMAADVDIMDRGITRGLRAVANALEGQAQFDAFRQISNRAALTTNFGAPASTQLEALWSNMRVQSAIYMAEGTLQSNNLRTSEIFEQLDVIDAILQQEMFYARTICANELYLELSKFRVDAVSQLYQKAYSAPGLAEYNFGGRVHPVVAAYSIYGDAKKHRELEGLNIVGNAGRIGPGVLAERRSNP